MAVGAQGSDAQQRDQWQREQWQRAAKGWERRQESLREKTAPVSQWLVDAIDPQPGERVLDLAAGPGETGFMVAQRIGDSGRLLCTDQAPDMLEVARRRAGELGLANVEFAVVDAQELDLEPGSFDAAVCRWGYMLMGDPHEAMRRTRRVLRDGGRLALATWDRPDRNLWMAAPVISLIGQGALPPPNPADPSPFAMHDPDDLERRLLAAGFSSVRTDHVALTQAYPSFETYWDETMDMAAPIAAAVAGLTTEAAEAVQATTRATLSPFIDQDGRLEVPGRAVVALAVA